MLITAYSEIFNGLVQQQNHNSANLLQIQFSFYLKISKAHALSTACVSNMETWKMSLVVLSMFVNGNIV